MGVGSKENLNLKRNITRGPRVFIFERSYFEVCGAVALCRAPTQSNTNYVVQIYITGIVTFFVPLQ